MKKRFMRCFGLVIITAVASSVAAAQTRQMVDVGGYRLEALRAGSGGPTIVFEAGLGDSLDTWAPVWPAIATTTTIVAYSRAGFGRSEAGPADRSARREVEELHALLARLRLPAPYVLVG